VCAERTLTVDGIEATFAVNHLSHFVLTQRLLPRLIESGPSRIITVASGRHVKGTMDFADIVRILSSATLPPTAEQQRAWVFRIARNLVIDHHRRQKHRQTEPLTADPVSDGRTTSADTAAIVHQALSRLDDDARDVFLMREVSGLSYVEIAEACQLTPDAVRSRIHRTRLQLRAQLTAPIASARAGRLCLHPSPSQSGHRS